VASTDDLAQFGPQAAQVRALLSFLPTMSDEAVRASGASMDAVRGAASNAPRDASLGAAWNAAMDASGRASRGAAWDAAGDAAMDASGRASRGAAWDAARASVVGDLISPENYRTLTNPLATGRAVDLLGSRPRNQGTPFLDVIRKMVDGRAITGPRDVVVASRLAKSPEDIREIALTLMADGMSAEEAMRTARLL
jgi:hypothetical protein